MNQQQLSQLLELLERDPSLRRQLEAAAAEGAHELVDAFRAAAAKVGVPMSGADVAALVDATRALSQKSSTEVADGELMGVAGGLHKRYTSAVTTVGDDAQLANVDLQNVLQQTQQYMQMLSNISKTLHDNAMAVIRKIGG